MAPDLKGSSSSMYYLDDQMWPATIVIYNSFNSTTITTTNLPITRETTPIPMGWREAEAQGTEDRVEKAKKVKVAKVKDVKRLVMGPKVSRWK